MLYFSLVLSAVVFAASLYAARPSPHPVRWWAFVVSACGTVFGTACMLISTVTLMQIALLTVALISWPKIRSRVRSFLPLAIGSTVVAYAIAFVIAANHNRKFDDMRERYPYESMEERVPEPSPAAPLTTDSDAWLTKFEREADVEQDYSRTAMLRRLHDDTVGLFVNSPGFGVARMMEPSERALRPRERGESREQSVANEIAEKGLSAADESELLNLHEARILDFVNVPGFGHVKNRRRVAGFIPHGFGRERDVKTKWEAVRIELIGLLLHSEPVVYLSSRLPAMSEVRGARTRPLDPFEASALAEIRKGTDLVPGGPEAEPRLVGAIRSARQCVECHGGKRGDLLGAFSYRLRRAEERP
jgi:hypothetical protein